MENYGMNYTLTGNNQRQSKEKTQIINGAEIRSIYPLVRIRDVVSEIQIGFACNKKNQVKYGVSHLRPNNIGYNGVLDLSKLVYIPESLVNLNKYSLKEGDVLFNNTNSKELVGRAVLVNKDFNCGYSNHITRLRVKKDIILPKWLMLSINFLWMRGYFQRICRKWVGQAGVNSKMLLETKIPLPPLAEQQSIVIKIDQFMSKIEELEKKKEEEIKKIEKIMQAALAKVFLRAEEKGWKKVELSDLLIRKPQYGLTSKSSYEKLPIRYIRITDITEDGELKAENPRYVDLDQKELQKYMLQRDDILISRSGSVGRMYLHKNVDEQCVFASYLIRFKLDSTKILPKYLFFFRYSNIYRSFIKERVRIVAQPNINAREYSSLVIPLPSLKEQRQIVRYLESLYQNVKLVRNRINIRSRYITELKNTILEQTFNGNIWISD